MPNAAWPGYGFATLQTRRPGQHCDLVVQRHGAFGNARGGEQRGT